MARQRFSVSTEGEIALTAATARTAVQILTPTNIRVAVRGFILTFDGLSPTAEPGSFELLVQTSAGTMSAASSVKDDRSVSDTVQTSGFKAATAEPTDAGASAIMRDGHVHPQTGVEFRWMLEEEVVLSGATRCGLRLNFSAAVNVRARLYCEE